MSRLLLVLVLVLGVWGAACTNGDPDQISSDPPASTATPGPESTLPLVQFTTDQGTVMLATEVADTSELTTCGLMHRDSLPEEQGMLFVFQADSQGGFWMKNTRIPLSIAFIQADGRIVDILQMEPGAGRTNLPVYVPRAPYRYAIETNVGWFERKGIEVGDQADVQAAVARGSEGQDPPLCQELGF